MKYNASVGVVSVALLAILISTPADAATCGANYGDLNIDETVDVLDVQCCIEVVLGQLTGEAVLPDCLEGSLFDVDVDGNGLVSVSDVAVIAALALSLPLPASIDIDSSGCADANEVVCGDGICDEVLGEDCLDCGFDCGACPDPCCAPHATSGCAEPDVEACVCDISTFCCDILWDSTCVDLAIEFCDPSCGGSACPTSGTITCGQTVSGNTLGAANVFESYSCDESDVAGPERVYGFFAPSDSGFEAVVTPTDAGVLTVRVLDDSCESTSCIAGGNGASAATATTAGQFYYLVIDGPLDGAGPFDLTLQCADECDVPALCGDQACGSVTCGGVPFSCGTCAEGQTCSAGECLDFVPFPGCESASGDCFSANDTIGCNDPVCCSSVCADDGFCCSTSWDGICAEGAGDLCSTTGDPGDPGDPSAGPCVGFCGDMSPSGCWCDGSCVILGDCCSDACATCGSCM